MPRAIVTTARTVWTALKASAWEPRKMSVPRIPQTTIPYTARIPTAVLGAPKRLVLADVTLVRIP